MKTHRDIWIDFNDVGEDSRARTLLRFRSKGSRFGVGDVVTVGDDEGNLCEAEVVGLEGAFVDLVVDGNTFRRTARAGQPTRVPA